MKEHDIPVREHRQDVLPQPLADDGGWGHGCATPLDVDSRARPAELDAVGTSELLYACRRAIEQASRAYAQVSYAPFHQPTTCGEEVVSVLEALENLTGVLADQVRRRNAATDTDVRDGELAARHLAELHRALSIAGFHAHVFTAAIGEATADGDMKG